MELDPRWEWVEIRTLGSAQPRFIKGRCYHLDIEPVTAVGGEVVAQLCLTCDAQLPAPKG